MNLEILARLMGTALQEPPQIVLDQCDNYYSPYYYLFWLLGRYLEEGLFVELGVEKGRGSSCLALGAPEATVIGVDHTRRVEVASVLERFPNFVFLEESSMPVPGTIVNQGQEINFLHIDTEHSYSMAREEFNAYTPLLADRAIVCFDDLHAMESDVAKYYSTLQYPKIQDDRLHPGTGFGTLIYLKETEDAS